MEIQKEPALKFRSLTPGLGLDHFQKTTAYESSKGGSSPRVQSQPQKRILPLISTLNSAQSTVPVIPVRAAQKRAEVLSVSEARSELDDLAAPAFSRGFAYLVDSFIVTALFFVALVSGLLVNGFSLGLLVSHTMVSLAPYWGLLFATIYFLYFCLSEILTKKTLGKALMGLHTETPHWGLVVLRTGLHLLSLAPFGIGLLWMFFDEHRRCWHDVIAESAVILDS